MTTNHLEETKEYNCPLCENKSNIFTCIKHRIYYKCDNCFSIFLAPNCRLDEASEKKRYLEHNNDINDQGYRDSVAPITDYIFYKYSKYSLGLDFGAGTGPVISSVLTEKGYNVLKYDPFFYPDKSVLDIQYDYIVCCEVIEHFYNPKKEFLQLMNCIKKNGELICKTDLFEDSMDFNNWYYNSDPTHVFFYSKNTFMWIKKQFGFTNVSIEGRLILLEK